MIKLKKRNKGELRMKVMLSEARSGFKQRIAEAEQHLKVLEELRKRNTENLPYHPKEYERVKKEIDALNFAIDFIKWGMK